MPGCFKMTHFPLPFQPATMFTLYIQVFFFYTVNIPWGEGTAEVEYELI